MSMPTFPSVEVHLPPDGDTGVVRSRVHKALVGAGQVEAAERYLVQTEAVRSHPDALLAATRDWVTLHIEAGSTVAPAMDPIAHGPLADLTEDLGSSLRWQYAIVNVGMFHSAERMGSALAAAGAHGWELVTIYDKASNGWAELEKGFLLLKRQVPPGVAPRQWCYVLRG